MVEKVFKPPKPIDEKALNDLFIRLQVMADEIAKAHPWVSFFTLWKMACNIYGYETPTEVEKRLKTFTLEPMIQIRNANVLGELSPQYFSTFRHSKDLRGFVHPHTMIKEYGPAARAWAEINQYHPDPVVRAKAKAVQDKASGRVKDLPSAALRKKAAAEKDKEKGSPGSLNPDNLQEGGE
jgi:hypothetical protein